MTADGRLGAARSGALGRALDLVRCETGARSADRAREDSDAAAPDGATPDRTTIGEHAGLEADAELAARATGGDRLAFARLYERFAPAVHGVLLATGPREEANDLVQEVFLLALRAIPRLADPTSVGPWLLAIARNRARDAHKSRRPIVALPEQLEPVAPEAEHERSALEDEHEAARALDAVRSLPEAYRETLILRLVEGLSGPEIADRTGMTHGSVRVNLHRGMKLLREKLARGGAA